MKTVFNSSEVAHIWATQQQETGRNSQGNFYFRKGTIYSYGSHFPIATINGNDVFFTLRSYSNTTAKHINEARQAASHKNFIYVHDVPEDFRYLSAVHEANITYWKKQIAATFKELGNKRLRDITSRINKVQNNISQLETYCQYFKLPIKDKELKNLLKLAASPDFVTIARGASEKEAAALAKKMKQATKAFEQYISLWREYKDEEIKELPDNIKALCNFYANNHQSFTRLRFNTEQNRLETSKGVQIPAEVAKRAYLALNGCMEGSCKSLSIPVMSYTITETGKDYIKAGCHTIPKSDVQYIANLLNW